MEAEVPPPGAGAADGSGGPAMVIGNKRFAVREDGTAADPDAVRMAMRSDTELVRKLRREKPEWASIILNDRPDGTYDVKKFQRILRENHRNMKHSRAMQTNDDGSAVNPAGFLEATRDHKEGRKWLKEIKEKDAELGVKINEGDTDALQEYLRRSKLMREQKDQPAPPPPPNPETPYDNNENMEVQMSMRILTDEGEEKDLFQVTPKETDEEKWHMPRQMRCTACQAVAFQAASAVVRRLTTRYKDELVGTATLEALQETCNDADMWTREYGLMPTAGGFNVFNGTGITLGEGVEMLGQDVMLSVAHGAQSARKLQEVCMALTLGADALEEDEFASMGLEAGSDVDAAVARFRSELCEKSGAVPICV